MFRINYCAYVIGRPLGSIRRKPKSLVMLVPCHRCGAPFWIDQDLMTMGKKRDHTCWCRKCAGAAWAVAATLRPRKHDPNWLIPDMEILSSNHYRVTYLYNGYRGVPAWDHLYIAVGRVSFLVGGGAWVPTDCSGVAEKRQHKERKHLWTILMTFLLLHCRRPARCSGRTLTCLP